MIDKLKYITHGGVACPQCDSHDITGGKLNCDEPETRPVECNACGLTWVETLRPVDIELSDGEIKPLVFPIHQIFDVKWIGVIYTQGRLDLHGPFVADKLQVAIKRLRSIHQKFAMAPVMFEIRIAPESGQLFSVQIDEEIDEPGTIDQGKA